MLAAAAFGILIGAALGLLGGGGSILAVPVLLLAFAVLMVAVAFRMLWGRVEPRGSCVTPAGSVNWRGCLPKAIGTGAVVGFLTGLFGVGGGARRRSASKARRRYRRLT